MARLEDVSVGKVGFIERHGLWSDQQRDAAERVRAQIEEAGLTTVRIAWGDQHGVVRGKTLTVHDFLLAMRNGQDFQTATLYMDTTNNLFEAPQVYKLQVEGELMGQHHGALPWTIVRPTAYYPYLSMTFGDVKNGLPYRIFDHGQYNVVNPIAREDLAEFITNQVLAADALEQPVGHRGGVVQRTGQPGRRGLRLVRHLAR